MRTLTGRRARSKRGIQSQLTPEATSTRVSIITRAANSDNTNSQYDGVVGRFIGYYNTHETMVDNMTYTIDSLDTINIILVHTIVGFLDYAANDGTMKPDSLGNTRSALSSYYKSQGHGENCTIVSNNEIRGNPAKHVFVGKFLKGYRRIWNETHDDLATARCEPLLYQDIQIINQNIKAASIPQFMKIYLQFYMALAFNGFLRCDE